MNAPKVAYDETKGKSPTLEGYDHYVALDWSMTIMAVAHMGRSPASLHVVEGPASVKDLKAYLSSLHGAVVLTLEETTTAQWLYVELRDSVTRIIVCDPFHNRLLCHGPKTDKIDAAKLCQLLRAGLLTEVFHTSGALYELRRLVSTYEDVVRAGVRCANQQDALARSHVVEGPQTQLARDYCTRSLALYAQTKHEYEKRFGLLCRRMAPLKHLVTVPGIGPIAAVKILAYVVDARRFPCAAHYVSYCGLVKHEKRSGRKSYGRRKGRFNHALKAVYKIAALAALRSEQGPFRTYYEDLRKRGLADYNARHAVARLLARVTYGMLKHGQAFHAEHLGHHPENNANN